MTWQNICAIISFGRTHVLFSDSLYPCRGQAVAQAVFPSGRGCVKRVGQAGEGSCGGHAVRRRNRPASLPICEKSRSKRNRLLRPGGSGWIQPPKSSTTDLQSAPFGHSGTLPCRSHQKVSHCLLAAETGGAGRRTRTPDLLITNQLLYQLSYTSTISNDHYNTRRGGDCQLSICCFCSFF